MAEQTIRDKTVRGVGWSAIDNISQYAVSFVVSIILARLLSPDDYGLLGIIAIFTSVCAALINGGFSSALIRKKDANDDDYGTAFIVNLVVSLLLYAVIYFFSPLIALFFGREELVALTRVSSLSMIIGALAIVQQVRLTKIIDFKTQTKITIISTVISGIIGIVMAFCGFGVWSLVAQRLSADVLRTVLLWFYNHWTDCFRFSINSFRELFGFGWKMMMIGLLDTVWKELYQVVVGRFYNPSILGQYTRAKDFSKIFSSNLTNVVQRVTYPVLSTIQDETPRMVAAYRSIIKTTMFISAVCMLSLGAVSDPLLYCLIGPQWHEAAVYLPLICLTGSMYPLHAINLNMLQVQGRSDLFLALEIIKKIIALGPLFVGAFVGILQMLEVSFLTNIIHFFLNTYYSGKFVGYSPWRQLKDIAPSYGVAIVIALSVYFLKYLPISYWVVFPLQIILGTVVFFTICKITKLKEYEDVKEMIKPFIQKIKRI